MKPAEHIPIAECKRRHVYRLHSRNLKFGVFAPEKDNGFIGIRTKFKSRYLFTEHHSDNGAPYGTVYPLEDLGPLKDDKLRLIETMPTICGYCGERLEYEEVEGGVPSVIPGAPPAPGHWKHLSGDGSCDDPRPEGHKNRMLFDALEKIEHQHKPDEQRE